MVLEKLFQSLIIVILLHINKITFEKSEDLEKKLDKSEPG